MKLSPRQTEVLQLMADGKCNKEIATQLWLTVDTIKHHQSAARTNLGAHTNTEAVATAIRMGFIR